MRRFAILLLVATFMVSSNVMAYKTTKKVVAHRGVSSLYPENTLVSFRRAIESKAHFIELDVHLTQDDVAVVIHDEDLSRTTNGHGMVRDYPLMELKRLNAGFTDKFGAKFIKEKIPTLEEAIDLIVGNSKKYLLIEIKYRMDDPEYRERMGKIVYDTVMKKYSHKTDQFAFISFDHYILEKIRELDRRVTLGPIFAKHPKKGSLADAALKLNTDVVIFSKRILTSERVLKKTNRVKHFIYTLLPGEFRKYEKFKGLYGFATDFAQRIE